MMRFALSAAFLAVFAVAASAQAPARGKAAPAAKAAAGAKGAKAAAPVAAAPAGATLLENFGDWGAYATAAGRTRVCYALSQPKDRLPKNLNRDPAYLFVSFRKPENVTNEVAMVLGFAVKEAAGSDQPDMKLAVDRSSFPLLGKGTSAWLKDPAQEAQAVAAMAKGQNVTINAVSLRGNKTTDRYALSGFAKALERARAECK